ncbi:TetR/AcrR family transcriptional regulator C-terminal domain-containing protein [Streptomyces cahuitamycinicus]|uniref:TetR/AcrR family transcriptional regulator C-terminal domain-containing protein n=1 Tax=Streptomyces cahuitamycinicus TaxID=2070367 RepID=UPI001FE33D0F|nr:TetR/AcrR family transcriptional regulator C-terminal domain-containing protein [Streptomyces cahuitamycinicus]
MRDTVQAVDHSRPERVPGRLRQVPQLPGRQLALGQPPAVGTEPVRHGGREPAGVDGAEDGDPQGAADGAQQRLGAAGRAHVAGLGAVHRDEHRRLLIDRVSRDLAAPQGATDWREVLRSYALQTRELMLAHPWKAAMPTPVMLLTPSRMAVADRQPAALAVCGLDADSVMAAFRAVTSFVHGSAQSEIGVRDYQERHGWTSGDETREALAPQMRYLVGTRAATRPSSSTPSARPARTTGPGSSSSASTACSTASGSGSGSEGAGRGEAPGLLDGGGPGLRL